MFAPSRPGAWVAVFRASARCGGLPDCILFASGTHNHQCCSLLPLLAWRTSSESRMLRCAERSGAFARRRRVSGPHEDTRVRRCRPGGAAPAAGAAMALRALVPTRAWCGQRHAWLRRAHVSRRSEPPVYTVSTQVLLLCRPGYAKCVLCLAGSQGSGARNGVVLSGPDDLRKWVMP